MALFLAVDLYEQAAGSESRRRIERKRAGAREGMKRMESAWGRSKVLGKF